MQDPLGPVDRQLVQIRDGVDRAVKRFPLLQKRVIQESRPSTPLPHLGAIADRLADIACTPSIAINDAPARHATHADALYRICFASIRPCANLATLVYLVYLESADPEADTFWVVQKLLALTTDSNAIASRLKWADEHLYSVLCEHDLDPASPLYTYRWLHDVLAGDLAPHHALPLLDEVIRSKDRSGALVDICVGMLIACKRQLFRPRMKGMFSVDDEVDFVKGLTFLRAPDVDAGDVLRIVKEMRSLPSPSLQVMTPWSPPLPKSPRMKPLLLEGKARRVSSTHKPEMMLALALVGIRRSPVRVFSRFKSYARHVPLNMAQNALLAVGSGTVGVLDTRRGDLVATLSESTASAFLPALTSSMQSTAEGRQILRDRPLLSSHTVDLGRLQEMKRGTLGREYVEWLRRGGLTPDTREKVSQSWQS